MGGISRTVNYKGNRIDIGGHRFFSKSDRVMDWWLQFMPIADSRRGARNHLSALDAPRGQPRRATGGDADRVMLVRNRKSRIYFLRRFFTYPITLSKDTVLKLGLWRTFRIGMSYLYSVARPIRQEKNLEEFFINRFGRMLYRTFFKSYTEKVWGVPCHEISAEWGAQRIKGLSILKSLKHAFGKLFGRRSARPGAEIDRDFAHRTLLVSQVRARPDVGNRGRGSHRPRRPHHHRRRGAAAAPRRRPRHARRNPRCRDRPNHALQRRLCSSRPCRSRS